MTREGEKRLPATASSTPPPRGGRQDTQQGGWKPSGPATARSRSVLPASSCARAMVTPTPAPTRRLRSTPRITDRLTHWATVAPERPLLARRMQHADGSRGDWRVVTYGEGACRRPASVGLLLDAAPASNDRWPSCPKTASNMRCWIRRDVRRRAIPCPRRRHIRWSARILKNCHCHRPSRRACLRRRIRALRTRHQRHRRRRHPGSFVTTWLPRSRTRQAPWWRWSTGWPPSPPPPSMPRTRRPGRDSIAKVPVHQRFRRCRRRWINTQRMLCANQQQRCGSRCR